LLISSLGACCCTSFVSTLLTKRGDVGESSMRDTERVRIRNRVEPEYVSVGIKALYNGLG
jgi:hypothetical protein